MMLCYSKTKKIKYILPLPPPKKRLKDTNGRDMSTRTSVCLYQQPVTWILTGSRLSRLSDLHYKVMGFDNYYLIIVVFFQAHISAFMIFVIH